MKIVKNIGLWIVMVALVIFISTLFLADYKLSTSSMEQSGMSSEQQKYFLDSSEEIIGKLYMSKQDFLAELEQTFEKANEKIIQDFQVSNKDFSDLTKLAITDGKISYSTDLAIQLFPGNGEVNIARIKGIKDYTSWLEGRTFESEEEFARNLSESISNYNNGIIYNKGFDNFQQQDLTLNLTLQSTTGLLAVHTFEFFILTFILAIIGSLLFIVSLFFEGIPGIRNNNIYHNQLNSQGFVGIVLGIFLILFYIVLYFFPIRITEWIYLSGIISEALFNRNASQWFLYGLIYTIAVVVMGIRFLTKYRHNRYQQIRTYSVMFFQLVIAFILPQILFALSLPEVDLKNIWPLDYSLFYDWRVDGYQQSGALGMTMFIWAIGLIIIGVPVLTYFYGKRFYCSWVCGCGGLAETAGDPFRQLSSKKLSSWKIERVLIHSVMVFSVLMTIWVLYTTITSKRVLLGINSYEVRKVYGFLIGSVFAGVVGTGFYPLMGNRVWCRFGCPLAAYIGIFQRFKSRFRITTNGGQCISCGNCSTYCEMGIDVRWYAQRGQNIIRSSCVGCGICSAVCPRGVLKLENRNEKGRFKEPVLIGNDVVINIRQTRKDN